MIRRAAAGLLTLLMVLAPTQLKAQTEDCSITRASEFDRLLDQGKTKIFFVKYEEALNRLKRAEDSLPCLVDPLGRVSLGRLYLYKGVALFFLEKTVESRAAFEQALVLDRRVRWDEQFGDLPKELFLEAKEAVIEYPKGNLRIPTDLKPGAMVYVDGDPYESGTTVEDISVGFHFVQAVLDDKVLQGAMFNVRADKTQTVSVPPELMSQREPFDTQKLRPVAYGTLAASGVALLAGTGAGILTWLTQKTLQENYYANRPDDEKDRLLARQKTLAYVADACFGAAVLFGGTGAVLYVISGPKDPDDLYVRRSTRTFHVKGRSLQGRWYPWASPGTAGVAIQGTF